MCGIVGVFGCNHAKKVDIFEQLLQIDVIRGYHSTGALKVTYDNKPYIVKELGPPCFLISSKKYREKIDNKEAGLLFLGHNRLATKGEVDRQNAHPFRSGNILLVHNGTLHNHLILTEVGDPTFNTDSETLTFAINKYGIEETWKKVDGAATIVWWDTKDNTLNMLTNRQRPFHFWTVNGNDGVVFASEKWMINGICERNHIKLDGDNAYEPYADHILTWVYEKGKVDYTWKQLEKKKWGWKGKWGYNEYEEGWEKVYGQPSNIVPFEQPKPDLPLLEDKREVPISALNMAWFTLPGQIMQREQFILNYQHCCYCGKGLHDEFETASILDRQTKEAICGECTTGFFENEEDSMFLRKGM